ncbi:hypothetical protein AVEN_105435-1 [Araneus ventricosus]|uniref:Uncharacterized protein n=1 Tax=Araneus ventricosus TaxID=182803 RepID=A0A4Y2IGZ8_ARAVE|nr:hypothetical protein AVEN_105435-1 [Araneus ventricosus]
MAVRRFEQETFGSRVDHLNHSAKGIPSVRSWILTYILQNRMEQHGEQQEQFPAGLILSDYQGSAIIVLIADCCPDCLCAGTCRLYAMKCFIDFVL